MLTSYSVTHPVQRVTALWALSESALAGILHALRLPFTGLFMASAAVLFMTLIHYFNPKKGIILQSMLIVMAIKAMVSPHTPVNAYLAVGIQGVLAEVSFYLFRSLRISVFILAFGSLLEAALQKLFILTLVFGNALWDSINIFGRMIYSEFLFKGNHVPPLTLSFVLISIYVGLHILAGIGMGLWIPGFLKRLQNRLQEVSIAPIESAKEAFSIRPKSGGRRWKKRLGLAGLFLFALSLFVFSYIFPFFEKNQGMVALKMIIRSIGIMALWYFWLAPFAMRLLKRYLDQKKSEHIREINHILKLMPLLKEIVRYSWQATVPASKFKRLAHFLETLLARWLTVHLES